jgi:hypothetical protein
MLTAVENQREAVTRILNRIAALDPAERGAAFTGLMVLAGLRNLEGAKVRGAV